jgi:hypothetical protein
MEQLATGQSTVVNKFINNQVERKISWIYAVSLE